METLIWKYLDGECTDEEKTKVALLLKSDPSFYRLYHSLTTLDHQLATEVHSPITEEFRLRIEKMMVEVATNQPIVVISPAEIFSTKWKITIAALLAIAVGLTIYLSPPLDAKFIALPFRLPDDNILSMINSIFFGVIMLYLLDLLIQTWRKRLAY
jgi:anti-sigma factor RsiW